MPNETPMRRQPKQARSRQKVDHLLDTAAQVFEEVGYEAATTNAIAARAEIAIGSLYQFFPNKAAIIDALIERYLADMQVVFTFDPNAPISTTIDHLIEQLAQFDASRTGFHVIFLEADVENRIHQAIIAATKQMLAIHFPELDSHITRQTAIAGIAIVKGMMHLSKSAGNLPESVALTEVKLALLAYLRAVLIRAGFPLPPDLQKGL